MNILHKILQFLTLSFLLPTLVAAEEVNWKFRYAVDGDTLAFYALDFPKPLQKMSIRIDGIDTPESTYRAKCETEKKLGVEAKEFVKYRLTVCDLRVTVTGWGKYGGRALGDIYLCGEDLKHTLISKGYARPYDGGKKSDWCADEKLTER